MRGKGEIEAEKHFYLILSGNNYLHMAPVLDNTLESIISNLYKSLIYSGIARLTPL